MRPQFELPSLGRVRAWLRRRGSLRRRGRPNRRCARPCSAPTRWSGHGRTLAAAHKLGPAAFLRNSCSRGLAENEALLTDACQQLAEAAREGRRISPAGEWLLDNFYLVEEQVRIAQRHLPRGYSRELPRLARGPSAGMPRVYDIAPGGDRARRRAHRRRGPAPLRRRLPVGVAAQLGELWAVPIMLRLALIENLRRVAASVIAERSDRALAAHWASA
jgi:hypothetical protein